MSLHVCFTVSLSIFCIISGEENLSFIEACGSAKPKRNFVDFAQYLQAVFRLLQQGAQAHGGTCANEAIHHGGLIISVYLQHCL